VAGAHSRSRWKGVVGAVVALPLVLPPTVLGFYLLVALGPERAVLGELYRGLGLGRSLVSLSPAWWSPR
jgi:molybdate transport system permease protein